MICRTLGEGERFECAGNLYSMLIPRDDTGCLEAVAETIPPGRSTPPNAHHTFVQLLIFLAGRGRVHIDGQIRELHAPAVAFIPKQTLHFVENIDSTPLQYMYVSIWPGRMPAEDKRPWREACAQMIDEYARRGYPPRDDR